MVLSKSPCEKWEKAINWFLVSLFFKLPNRELSSKRSRHFFFFFKLEDVTDYVWCKAYFISLHRRLNGWAWLVLVASLAPMMTVKPRLKLDGIYLLSLSRAVGIFHCFSIHLELE